MEILPVRVKVDTSVKADTTPIIKTVADVGSALTKGAKKILWSLVGTWVIRKERVMALLEAQTERDCADIRQGRKSYKDGELLDCPDSQLRVDVYGTLHSLNHAADVRRLKAVIEEAIRQICQVPEEAISDNPISQTFFNKWRREAEMIDDDNLRSLWAGLLKEEAISPNRVSYRTLDVVKNLSHIDCERFIKICRGEIKGDILVSYDNRPVFGTYEDILSLQDLGLVNNLQSAAKIESRESCAILSFKGARKGIKVNPSKFWVHTFSVTSAGRDLLRLGIKKDTTDTDVVAIQEFLVENGSLGARDILLVDIDGDGREYEWQWIRGHRPAVLE